MKDKVSFKDLRLALVGVGCALVGFLTSYVVKPDNEMQPVAENNVRVAMTHPGMFRKPGFIPCQTIIVNELDKAQESVHVQAYGFTCIEIAEALCRASKRGVKVRILLDKENESKSSDALRQVLDAGIEVKIRRISGISHNKVMVIDKRTVITGSFNFTKSANERNDENLLIVQNPKVAEQYLKHWFICYEESHKLGEVIKLKTKPWESKMYGTRPKTSKLADKSRLNLKIKELKGATKPKKGKDAKRKQKGRTKEILQIKPSRTLWIAVPSLKELVREDPEGTLINLRNSCARGIDVRIVLDTSPTDPQMKSALQKLITWGAKVKVGKVKDSLIICDDTVTLPRKASKSGKLYPPSLIHRNAKATNKAMEVFSQIWINGAKVVNIVAPADLVSVRT